MRLLTTTSRPLTIRRAWIGAICKFGRRCSRSLVTFPTLSSTVALDDPLYDQSGHSHGVGWDVTHARPPGCAVNTLPYVPGVSTALSPKYQVNCTGSGNFDLEGWDFGDKYQPGGIPATINSTSGWCKYANNNMDDSANTWALGYNADMVKVSGCPLNSVMSDPTHNGIVMINNYFDYKANTTWVGGFTMGIYINSALGSKAFKYNHWGNATYRPVEINGTCVDGNEIDAFYNDQSVAWQITGLNAPHADPGVNFECTISTQVSTTVDEEFNLQINNGGAELNTGAYVPTNVGSSPGMGVSFTFRGNVIITNVYDVPFNITMSTGSTIATVNSVTNTYGRQCYPRR